MDTELPKRLYKEGTEPQVDKINKCAKMSILKVLKKHMEDELNEVKKDPVFAHILAIYDNRLAFSAKLVHSFMSRRLLTSKKHELWFVFARRPLRFSLQEFHAVTGLKCQDDGNYELGKWDDDGGFWSKLIKRKGKISMTTIREEHVLQAHKWSRLDRLRLVYLCVIAGVLLAVDEKTEIAHKYIKLIMEFENLREYPWGLHSFDHLVEGVIKAELWKPKSYVLEGFSYALQIWIMEAIPDCGVLLGKKLDNGSIVSPRCSNWTGAPVRKDLNKNNTHCGIYALKHIECHVLGLTLSLVNDDNIKEARHKVATDLLQAARDEVFVERMTKYIPPKFTSSEVVDISGP